MVPHETLETKILELLGFETGEQGIVTVVGVPDRSKGELLVLLTTRDLSRNELRKRLLAAGVPILWIPKVVKRIEKIPILGTGKVDLSKCQQLAMSGDVSRMVSHCRAHSCANDCPKLPANLTLRVAASCSGVRRPQDLKSFKQLPSSPHQKTCSARRTHTRTALRGHSTNLMAIARETRHLP